jgi:hypothetical protein
MISVTKETKFGLGLLLILIPFLIALLFTFRSEAILIPRGYDLAIDGYVISRTLMIIFALYLSTKIGFKLYEGTKKE